jgi:hypothetical protein
MLKKGRLIISALDKFPQIKNNNEILYKYILGVGEEYSGDFISINDQKCLNEIAESLRDDYANWIYSLNDFFIEENLVYEENLSLFFLTDLSCKRTELFPTYDDICNLYLITEKLKKIDIDVVEVYGASEAFKKALLSKFGNRVLKFHSGTQKKSNSLNRELWRWGWEMLIFFGKYAIISILATLNHKRKESYSECERMFLTRYPLHFPDRDSLKEEKYGSLVNVGDMYVVSLLTDGFHQNVSLASYFKFKKKLEQNKDRVHVLDEYSRVWDVLIVTLKSFSYFFKFKKLITKKYAFSDIDVTSYIEDELKMSYSRVCRLLLCMRIFERFLSRHNCKEFIYYLHEYSYGRAFSYILSKDHEISSVGMQHGPASTRKLLYHLGEGEVAPGDNYTKHVPVPQKVWAEDEPSKSIYEMAGYTEVSVLGKLPRLAYLKSITRDPQGGYILIVPGLHDGPLVIEFLKREIENSQDIQYVLKPHPRSAQSYLEQYTFRNLMVSSMPIVNLLPQAELVIATYSSVAIEARMLGIPVRLVEIPGQINQSPLIDHSINA